MSTAWSSSPRSLLLQPPRTLLTSFSPLPPPLSLTSRPALYLSLPQLPKSHLDSRNPPLPSLQLPSLQHKHKIFPTKTQNTSNPQIHPPCLAPILNTSLLPTKTHLNTNPSSSPPLLPNPTSNPTQSTTPTIPKPQILVPARFSPGTVSNPMFATSRRSQGIQVGDGAVRGEESAMVARPRGREKEREGSEEYWRLTPHVLPRLCAPGKVEK